MKHRVYGKHLGRDKDERSALFKTLVQSLFLHGTIETSKDKANAIKGLVDKVINLAKNKTRKYLLQKYLADKKLQERLIKEIVPKLGSRSSGYTSLIRLGSRYGDNTMMVRMSLIGAEELKPIEKESRIKNQESRKETKETDKISRKRVSKVVVKSKKISSNKKSTKRRTKKLNS